MIDKQEQIHQIWGKIYNGDRITLAEVYLVGWGGDVPGLFIQDERSGETKVLCPRNGCTGFLYLRHSKQIGWEPYIGCTESNCNFYTTRKKIETASKLHPSCPDCKCNPIIPPKKIYEEINRDIFCDDLTLE